MPDKVPDGWTGRRTDKCTKYILSPLGEHNKGNLFALIDDRFVKAHLSMILQIDLITSKKAASCLIAQHDFKL